MARWGRCSHEASTKAGVALHRECSGVTLAAGVIQVLPALDHVGAVVVQGTVDIGFQRLLGGGNHPLASMGVKPGGDRTGEQLLHLSVLGDAVHDQPEEGSSVG